MPKQISPFSLVDSVFSCCQMLNDWGSGKDPVWVTPYMKDIWSEPIKFYSAYRTTTESDSVVKAPEYPITNLFIDKNGAAILKIAVTGFDEKDISVKGNGSKLVIEAKKPDEDPDLVKIYGRIKSESFSASYECGEFFDIEKCEATIAKGVLTIKLPLKKEHELKEFTINVNK